MNAVVLVSRIVSTFAGCVLFTLSLGAVAGNTFPADVSMGRFDVHSVGDNSSAIPLFSVQLSATTDLMKGNTLDVTASYRSVALNQDSGNLHYNELSTEFSLNAPRIKSLDFSDSIREKVEVCPEKLIDSMIIDGAVGFNYQW